MDTVADTSSTEAVTPSPQVRLETPGLLLGPYYPLTPPALADGSLWRGAETPVGARPLLLQGRVLDVTGAPVAGATVELWQADPTGRYRHPSAPHADRVLEGFTGYGRVMTASNGGFEFTSVVPGGYTEGEVQRAPHLHLQITGRFDRLVTQIFLRDHPSNATDRWFRALARPERLLAQVLADDASALHLGWTAVLSRG